MTHIIALLLTVSTLAFAGRYIYLCIQDEKANDKQHNGKM